MNDRNATRRRSLIAQIVQENNSVRVSDLVRQFKVTETSIRRDLTILESSGVLKRTHGGAIYSPGHTRAESYGEKMRIRIEEKKRIGAAAAGLIRPDEVILLDSGTTTLQVLKNIPKELRLGNSLTIVTNSISIADEVFTWPSPNLILLGGIYLPDYHATVGPQALAQLRELTVDKVFLGADGLTIGNGWTTANILMAEVDRLMVERARQVILVADSSKLGRVGFVPIRPLSSIHTLLTDEKAPSDLVRSIRDIGVEVVLV